MFALSHHLPSKWKYLTIIIRIEQPKSTFEIKAISELYLLMEI